MDKKSARSTEFAQWYALSPGVRLGSVDGFCKVNTFIRTILVQIKVILFKNVNAIKQLNLFHDPLLKLALFYFICYSTVIAENSTLASIFNERNKVLFFSMRSFSHLNLIARNIYSLNVKRNLKRV